MAFLLFSIIVLFYLLSAIRGVACHGFVHTVNVGGMDYPGWNPFADQYLNPTPARVVRKIQSDGPVPGADANLACGIGGDDGTLIVADAAAGSQISFKWGYWPADHQGPVSTYMASCDGDCTKFSANGARWFKLDAGGYDRDTKKWAADQLRAKDNTWTSTIPAQLKAGQYLVRNEIIALHSQTPQFYPSCAQVRVTGSGTRSPSDSDLVFIRDVYQNVQWPFIYGDFGTFTIPGPAPVTFGDNPGTSTSPRPSAVTSTSASSATGSGISGGQQPSSTSIIAYPPAATGQCLLKERRLARKHPVRRAY